MTNNQHGQVPEALRLAEEITNLECSSEAAAKTIAAAADELCRQHAHITELEAQIEAWIGAQALSAAPGVTSEQRRLIGVIADKIEDGTLFQSGIYPKKDLARFVRNMLDTTPTAPAASPTPPTPPAEQQAQPGAVGRTGCTAGTDEECTRRGCATSCPAQQAAPKAAPGEPSDYQIRAITTAYEQGVGKGHQAYISGKETANPYDSTYRCDLAWQYGYVSELPMRQ